MKGPNKMQTPEDRVWYTEPGEHDDTKANTDFEDRADIEHDEMRDHEPDED